MISGIFERLRDEYGFTGGLTIVKDYVAGWRQRANRASFAGGALRPRSSGLPSITLLSLGACCQRQKR